MAGKQKRNNKSKNKKNAGVSDPAAASNGVENDVKTTDLKQQGTARQSAAPTKAAPAEVTGVSVDEILEGLEEVAKVLAKHPASITKRTEMTAKETPAETTASTPPKASTSAAASTPENTVTPKTSTSSMPTPINPAIVDDLKVALKDIVKRDEKNATWGSEGVKEEGLKTTYESVKKACNASDAAGQQPEGVKSRGNSIFAEFEVYDPDTHPPPPGQKDGRSISQLLTPELCARAVSNVRRELAAEAANGSTSIDSEDGEVRNDSKQLSSDAGRHAEAQQAIHPVYRVDFKSGWDLVFDPNHLLPCNALKSGQEYADQGIEVGKEGAVEADGAKDNDISPRSHKARPAFMAVPESLSTQNENPRKARRASMATSHPAQPSSRAENLREAMSLNVRAAPMPIPSSRKSKRYGQHFNYFPTRPAVEEDPDAITPAPSVFERQLEMLGQSPPRLGTTLRVAEERSKSVYEDVDLGDEEMRDVVDKPVQKRSVQVEGKAKARAMQGMEYERQLTDAEQDDGSVIGRFAKWWGGCIHIGGHHREDEP